MSVTYLLKNIGIGDLIFFCGTILLNHNRTETIKISICKKILNEFRQNSINYKNFCFDYIKYFLQDYTIDFIEEDNSNFVWNQDYKLFGDIINNNNLREYIKNKLSNGTSSPSEYIVIFTKIRDLDKKIYKSISDDFYTIINNTKNKVILLGEREVNYQGEYAIHGDEKIYSIYKDCKEKINYEKLIDLTIPTYNFDNFSLESIIQDMTTISNAKNVIIFGGGGFFCLSLFVGNLISLTNNTYSQYFNSQNNPYVYSEKENFLNCLLI
jgi:hypothetical protein